jgi:hypothetical protein
MIVIHPGMVKSATTSLQELVFARHPEITLLGLPAANPEAKEAIRQICRADSIFYDHETVETVLAPLAAAAGDGTAVLSYENFALYESKDKGLIAERLHRLFPEARVLFTIRRQEDLLAAWYLQKMQKYLRQGHYLTFEDWFAMKAKLPHRAILDDLRFDEIITCYKRLFGPEQVHVLLFEELRAQPAAYCRRLGDILSIEGGSIEQLLAQAHANPTIPASLTTLARHLFPFLPRPLSKTIAKRLLRRGGTPARVKIEGPIARQVAELSAPGNRRLAADFGLPLGDYGYAL